MKPACHGRSLPFSLVPHWGRKKCKVFTVLTRVAELKWVSVTETSRSLGTRGYFRVASHNQCHSASAGVLIGGVKLL